MNITEEDCQKRYLNSRYWKLISLTDCNTTCMAVLKQSRVLSDEDVAELDSILNKLTKAAKLYEILFRRDGFLPHLIAALKEGCQTGALEILKDYEKVDLASLELEIRSELREIKTGSKHRIRFEVDGNVHFFTGRNQELTELQKLLNTDTSAAIVGLGGVGKTELARCYIQRFMKPEESVIWMNAESEQGLSEGFRRLATEYLQLPVLNADGIEKGITCVINDVYTFFIGKRSLFLFDNAQSVEDLQKFMPFRMEERPNVLITSRCSEWPFSVQPLKPRDISQMRKTEAIEFVKSGLKIPGNEKKGSVAKLVTRFQCLPLALTQVMSNIKKKQKIRSNYKIEEYLELFEYDTENQLNSNVAELSSYGKTTLTTWKITTDAIAETADLGGKALWMLNMLSYFKPENIPTTLLISHNSNEMDFAASQQERGFWSRFFHGQTKSPRLEMPSIITKSQNEDALHLLEKHSMIKTNPEVETINVHRVVQDVTKIELKKEYLEESVLRDAIKLLSTNTDVENKGHVLSVFKCCVPYRSLRDEFRNYQMDIVDKYEASVGVDEDFDMEEEMTEDLQERTPLRREWLFYPPKMFQNLRLNL